ncbi:hypothetical protein M9H77_19905 [Catharanthus roseus]|uniref:Uncharacterized protein n=1 Tax=Catharanthus roseus TaxID=4058 RepID=A0ACC0BBN8_CATRO|nr:hypothetical protein M9H77_19905 [Catharanthus roseus]
MSLSGTWNVKCLKVSYKPPAASFNIIPSRLAIRSSQHQHPQCPNSLFPPPNQSVAAIILGDGWPSGLYPLTKRRSEGAIPIGGNYRLIDSVVSNCINSNISKIYALTQFNSTSLNSHLSRAYNSSGVFLGKDGGFVEVLAACQSPQHNGWFQGSADAIRKCLWVLEEYPVVEFLILQGHHLYKMNYQKLIEAHRNNTADITVAVLNNTSKRDYDDDHHHHKNPASSAGFGTFRLNPNNHQVIDFISEPKFNNNNNNNSFLQSMGIYMINRDVMKKLLTEYFPTANDLRGEVIPGAISLGMKIQAFEFDGYWEDMRSIEAYYRANMESTKKPDKDTTTHNNNRSSSSSSFFYLYDRDSPIYTLPRNLPPTLITDAVITDSVIGDGCILHRCKIKGTVVGMRTRVGEGAIIEDSIIMGSDTYSPPPPPAPPTRDDVEAGIPIGIGEGSYIRKAIVDKNVRIGKNVKIINKDKVVEGNKEEDGYIITEGIVVVVKGAVISDGSIL